MNRKRHDIELKLDCICSEPWHFIHFGFDKEDPSMHGKLWPPELYVSFRQFHGSLPKRLKKAWKIIWSGWSNAESDTECAGLEEIEKLKNFCIECLSNYK